jgi:small subunit ribosomal protein S21
MNVPGDMAKGQAEEGIILLEIRVDVKNIETAIRLRKWKMQNEGVSGALKNTRFYAKPSIKKKQKRIDTQRSKRACC